MIKKSLKEKAIDLGTPMGFYSGEESYFSNRRERRRELKFAFREERRRFRAKGREKKVVKGFRLSKLLGG